MIYFLGQERERANILSIGKLADLKPSSNEHRAQSEKGYREIDWDRGRDRRREWKEVEESGRGREWEKRKKRKER